MDHFRLKTILADIRFWIGAFFAIRLVGITNAPLEAAHNWRQSLTNMIARNFVENGPDVFHPMIDMAGDLSGIIGSEFPLFNYLIYLVSLLFEYDHWYGRLINLCVSSLGLFYFYKLLRSLFDQRIAFNSTLILTTSIWFAFSRKIMPDTFSTSLMIIGLYCAYRFIADGRYWKLILFFVFSSLGMLSKIPVLSLLGVVAVLLFIPGVSRQRMITLFAAATLSFGVACLWYFYWVPHLLETYHYQLYFPKGLAEGMAEITPLMPELFERFYFSSFHSFIAFGCFLGGAFLLTRNRNRTALIGISIVSVVFALFIIKTGAVFPKHSYYVIPYVPIMAFIAGYFTAQVPTKFQFVLLGLITVEAIANQQHDLFIKEKEVYRLTLESIVHEHIPMNELVVINGGQSPQDLYFAHRKGWTVTNKKLEGPNFLPSLIKRGAVHLIIDKRTSTQSFPRYELRFEDEHYAIYKLVASQ